MCNNKLIATARLAVPACFRASLVPIFSFGENDLFRQADNPEGSWLRSFQERFKRLMGFAPPIFYGRGVFNYTFGLIPFRNAIHTVGAYVRALGDVATP